MILFITSFIAGIMGGVFGFFLMAKVNDFTKDPFEEKELPPPSIIPLNLKNENADYLREQVKKLHDRSPI